MNNLDCEEPIRNCRGRNSAKGTCRQKLETFVMKIVLLENFKLFVQNKPLQEKMNQLIF